MSERGVGVIPSREDGEGSPADGATRAHMPGIPRPSFASLRRLGMTPRPVSSAVACWLLAAIALAQSQPPQQPPPGDPPHDITQVDAAPIGGAIAVPLPEKERKRLQKYEIPELVGSRQALGSQLIDGRLRRPILDYVAEQGPIHQRLSIFEGGLVVVDAHGAGGTIRKKLLIPDDALKNYTKTISTSSLSTVRPPDVAAPRDGRRGALRVYDAPEYYVERQFDPMSTLPKRLSDMVVPLEDLLRAIVEDRAVTNTVANYLAKAGDQLVGDDQRVYRVERVVDGHIVELRCLSQPTRLYVEMKDLYLYFIGTPGAATR